MNSSLYYQKIYFNLDTVGYYLETTAVHQGLSKYLTAQDTHISQTSTNHSRTLSSHVNLLSLQSQSTIQECKTFSVLEVRNYSNLHPFFIWVSARLPGPWIFTSTHYVGLGTLNAMGSLQRLSCN